MRRICFAVSAAVIGRFLSDERQDDPLDVVHASLQGLPKPKSQKQSVDTILNDVLQESLKMRDQGKKPDAEFVYNKVQRRFYESQHGRKAPSSGSLSQKYVPYPPDFSLYRVVPFDFAAEDPFPARAITPYNPVPTKKERQDREAHFAQQDDKMYSHPEGRDVVGVFVDAVDELQHWTFQYVDFIRDAPLWQRRSLPLLHELYRYVAHRLLRAENFYIAARDRAAAKVQASSSLFAATEDRVDQVRMLCSETHRSLASVGYDPLRMKKTLTCSLLSMTPSEYREWKDIDNEKKKRLAAEFL